jgi:L-lactate dehydrogenase complex protein LldE
MKVGLFIRCYVDQCYPNVGLATVDLLERHGVEVDYPEVQTCWLRGARCAGLRP